MSHFAKIDENNIVVEVVVGNNNLPNEGKDVIELLGGTWIQTSYNSKIRGNFAGIGFSYLADEDIFMPPKCHEIATLDAKQAKWICSDESHIVKETYANN